VRSAISHYLFAAIRALVCGLPPKRRAARDCFQGIVMANLDQVRSFIEAWNARDLQRIGALMADDIFYHNIPLEPIRGRETVCAAFAPLIDACSEIDWRVHHIGEGADGVVLTERTDDFVRDGKRLSVRVMGAFELKDGLIIAWRDYFDLGQYQSQL
jgi:limonene-1,2-epoxide hydrolase